MGGSSERYSINLDIYSNLLVTIFTILWAFCTAILITTKAYRYDDFTFVTNRLSGNLSNILFLFTTSVIAGLTATMSGYLNRIIALLFFDFDYFIYSSVSIKEALSGVFAMILYIYVFAALGYLFGVLIQVNKLFAFVIPALFFGSMFIGVSKYGISSLIVWISDTYAMESSLLLFTLKVIVTVCLLFIGSIALSNRLEVKT